MKIIIISDLHLGGHHTRARALLMFLSSLPPDATLVLNGDTLDHARKHMPPEHGQVLERLRELSRTQPVIWLPGNHDEDVVLPDPAGIRFQADHAIGKRLYLAHGHHFDNILVKNRKFFTMLRKLYDLRVHLGLKPVHVAAVAKKFPWLFRILCRSLAGNAVQHAREQGFAAVTCGHVHHAEDLMIEGIRYINTGSWTEDLLHYLEVDEEGMRLVRVDPHGI